MFANSLERFAMRESLKTDSFKLSAAISVITEVLESGGEFEMYPKGVSMLPLIRQGRDSVVLVKPTGRLCVGDIAFYKRSDSHFMLHRVVAVEADGYKMCGDNQTVIESGVTDDMIIAVVAYLNIDGKKVTTDNKKYRRYVKRRMNFTYRKLAIRLGSLKRRIEKKNK